MLSRFLAPGLGVLLIGLFGLLYALDYPLYVQALTWYGVDLFRWPFVDGYAVLSAVDCARQGVDVFVSNPCHVIPGQFNYSPFLLLAKYLPITRHGTVFLGLAFAALFLGSLAALPPPRRKAEQALRVAVTLSPVPVFALERANFDVLVFGLVMMAGMILVHARRGRLLAYPILLLAGLLKYYPVVALVALLRERSRVVIVLGLCCGGALAAFVSLMGADILRSLATVPKGTYFAEAFGAVNLPRGLAALISDSLTLAGWWQRIGNGLLLLFGLYSLISARRWVLDQDFRARFERLAEAESLPLILGALVMVGCFWASQSVYYRAIFLLPVLPGLLAMARPEGDADAWATLLFRRLALLMIVVTWGEAPRHVFVAWTNAPSGLATVGKLADLVLWLVRELAWWQLIAMLAAVIWLFVRRAPILQDLRPRAILAWISPRPALQPSSRTEP